MESSHPNRVRSALLLAAIALAACSSEPAVYGAPCDEATPCTGGLGCIAAFPGGYCSSVCSGGAACGSGGVCDPMLVGGLCLTPCSSGAECRDGYQCWRGGCRPACTLDADCGDGTARCVGGQCTGPECSTDPECGPGRVCTGGTCTTPGVDAGLPDGGGTVPDGEACTSDAACVSGLCLPAARGGICTRPCTDASSCFDAVTFVSACAPIERSGGTETVCVPFDPAGEAGGAACSSDAECASGLCAEGLCSEACDDAADCIAGETCRSLAWTGGTFMGCGFAPRTGAVDLLEIDLGTTTVSAGSLSGTFEVGVPADAVSLTLQVERTGGDVVDLSFYTVTAPDGTSLFDLAGFSDLVDQPIRWYPGDGSEAITMLIPNTTVDRYRFQVGRYPFQLVAYGTSGSATLHVRALVKRATRLTAGTLDVAVHLVGVGLTASSAPGNARVSAMLDRMQTVLDGAGIALGDVTYRVVGGSTLSVIDSVSGPDSELAELFRLSAGTTGRALPLFLVRGIEAGGDGFNTLGIAGGIPGESLLYGHDHSGVVVAFDPAYISSGAAAGHVCGHESSHFLGLFHTTERLRPCATGESPSGGTCAPFGATDVINDTTRGDTGNLMNWSIVGSGSNIELTAGQSFVLLRSPVVR